jgi:hypothetical protein
LTIGISPPVQHNGKCVAKVAYGTLAITDVRVGTGSELNGRLYEYVDESCAGVDDNFLYLSAFSPIAIQGLGGLRMRGTIISPNAPTELAEKINVRVSFIAHRR